MKKNARKLRLHRETVHALNAHLFRAAGGGETWEFITGCACTDGCGASGACSQTCYTVAGCQTDGCPGATYEILSGCATNC